MVNRVTSNVVLTNKNYLAEAKTRNHYLTIDEPINRKGGDNGPTPVEYLLTAIGGCVAMTLRIYAEGQDWDIGEITVNVSQKVRLTSKGTIKSLIEEISFEKEVTVEQREKLLEMAGNCPVAKMVKGETIIETIIN